LVKQLSASHGSFHLRKIKTQPELREKYNLSVSSRLFSKYFLNFVIQTKGTENEKIHFITISVTLCDASSYAKSQENNTKEDKREHKGRDTRAKAI